MTDSIVCTRCKMEKSLTEFYKNKRNKSGYFASCKKCVIIKTKELRQKYSELEVRETKNKKVCCCCKIEKSFNEFHKDKTKRNGIYTSCKTCHNTKAKERAHKYAMLENRETKERKVCSGCKIEKNISEYDKNRFQKDGYANVCKNCRHKYYLIRVEAQRRDKMTDSKCEMEIPECLKSKLGIGLKTFTKWIEFQFEEGMNMDNHGSVWHLDFVSPISSFDEKELHKAVDWLNICPALLEKNMQKANKISQVEKAYNFIKYLEETNKNEL